MAGRRQQQEANRLADAQRTYNRQDLEKQMTRKFKPGEVYAPHDLTGVEMSKWKKIRRGERRTARGGKDVIDMLNINPIDHYKVGCAAIQTTHMQMLGC